MLTAAVDKAVAAGKAVHIMGLMSPGGVHSHEDHIMAMVELAAERGAEKSTCTLSSMAATRRRAALKNHWRNLKKNLPLSVKAAWLPLLAVTTPWTATIAGTALSRHMI